MLIDSALEFFGEQINRVLKKKAFDATSRKLAVNSCTIRVRYNSQDGMPF
jgi:hypothetical protein